MHEKVPSEALKAPIKKRVFKEFGSKILNEERLDKVMLSRKTTRLGEHVDMAFHCECGDETCEETISMSTEEYQRMHRKTKYFVVVPSHIRHDLEEIISSFGSFALVAKYSPHPSITA